MKEKGSFMIMKLYGFVKNFFCLFDWWKSWRKKQQFDNCFDCIAKKNNFVKEGSRLRSHIVTKATSSSTTTPTPITTAPTQITKTNAVGSETTTKAQKNSQIQKSTQHKKTNSMSNNNKNINNRKRQIRWATTTKKQQTIEMSPVAPTAEPRPGKHSFHTWNCQFYLKISFVSKLPEKC